MKVTNNQVGFNTTMHMIKRQLNRYNTLNCTNWMSSIPETSCYHVQKTVLMYLLFFVVAVLCVLFCLLSCFGFVCFLLFCFSLGFWVQRLTSTFCYVMIYRCKKGCFQIILLLNR